MLVSREYVETQFEFDFEHISIEENGYYTTRGLVDEYNIEIIISDTIPVKNVKDVLLDGFVAYLNRMYEPSLYPLNILYKYDDEFLSLKDPIFKRPFIMIQNTEAYIQMIFTDEQKLFPWDKECLSSYQYQLNDIDLLPSISATITFELCKHIKDVVLGELRNNFSEKYLRQWDKETEEAVIIQIDENINSNRDEIDKYIQKLIRYNYSLDRHTNPFEVISNVSNSFISNESELGEEYIEKHLYIYPIFKKIKSYYERITQPYARRKSIIEELCRNIVGSTVTLQALDAELSERLGVSGVIVDQKHMEKAEDGCLEVAYFLDKRYYILVVLEKVLSPNYLKWNNSIKPRKDEFFNMEFNILDVSLKESTYMFSRRYYDDRYQHDITLRRYYDLN